MASHHTRQELVRLAWGHQGDPANFDPKPLFAEIKACAGEEGRHLSRALPKLWKHLDYRAYDGMRFARATGLSAESFEALMGGPFERTWQNAPGLSLPRQSRRDAVRSIGGGAL